MGKQWKQWLTLFFWGTKITADGDCSHEIKRCLLWNKSYDQPRQHIKKQTHHSVTQLGKDEPWFKSTSLCFGPSTILFFSAELQTLSENEDSAYTQLSSCLWIQNSESSAFLSILSCRLRAKIPQQVPDWVFQLQAQERSDGEETKPREKEIGPHSRTPALSFHLILSFMVG